MEALTVVSISNNTDISRGWRVRTFIAPADWNSLGRTIAYAWFPSEVAARRYANEMAIAHNAVIQG